LTGNRLLADENAAAAASWSDSTATLNMHAAAQTASVAAAESNDIRGVFN